MGFYRKKIYLLLCIILLPVILSSCQTSKVKQVEKILLEEKIIVTKEDAGTEILDVYVHEGTAFLISVSEIIRYDLVSGERTVVAQASGNVVVCADDNYIYTYNLEQKRVIQYNQSGEVDKSYSLIYDQIDTTRMSIYNDTIIMNSLVKDETGIIGSELYKLNLTSGESIKLSDDFKGNDSFSFILGLDFIDEYTIMIASVTTMNFMNPIVKGYKFDLKNEKVLDEFFLPYSYSYTYDVNNQCFYYSDRVSYVETGKEYKLNIRGYYPDTSADIIFNSLNVTSISNSENLSVNKKFYYNNNLISWDKNNSCFIITDLTQDKKTLKLLVPEDLDVGFVYPTIIDQFETAYGYPVQVIQYPRDIYKEKLRTKLLASDNDFDLFILSDPTEDNLLPSILKQELYEPLDNNKEIENNFEHMNSGIRSMMSYKDRLYGVPIALRTILYHFESNFTQYRYPVSNYNWTMDDLWNLCEEIIRSGNQDVVVFSTHYNLIDFILNYVQNAVEQNYIDKAALTELLINIKKYMDTGVLFGNEHSSNNQDIKKHLISYGTTIDLLLGENTTSYPELGTISLPSYKKNYVELVGCVFINRFSENKEMAANFLEVMTRKENIYNVNIYRFALLGADLTQYDTYHEWSDKKRSYFSDLSSIFQNAGVYTYDTISLDLYIREEVVPGFYNGSISAEEAAEMIYDRVNYTYFE